MPGQKFNHPSYGLAVRLAQICCILARCAWCASHKSLVTMSWGLLFEGLVGVQGVMGAAGLLSFAAGTTWVTILAAASFLTLSTLATGHLCLLAVLQDMNLCPQSSHWCSCMGCLAAFAASQSCSRLAAQLCFCASHFFSFWALLALRLPFWRLKKALVLTPLAWNEGANSTQEIFPSSAFWAEMALAKRLAQERNPHQWKMLRMLKTKYSTSTGVDCLGTPPFTVDQSGPLELQGEVEDKGAACGGAGEAMLSDEDMMVQNHQKPSNRQTFFFLTFLSCDHHVIVSVTYCPSDNYCSLSIYKSPLFLWPIVQVTLLFLWHLLSLWLYCSTLL